MGACPMTRGELLAEMVGERYGPTRPDERYDSDAVKAERRRLLFRLPPAPGRRNRLTHESTERSQ